MRTITYLLLTLLALSCASCAPEKPQKEAAEEINTIQPAAKSEEKVVVTSPTISKRRTGLRIYDKEKAFNGYVLYTALVRPQGEKRGRVNLYPVYLMDMEGNIVHQWIISPVPSISFARLNDDGNLFYITNDIPSPKIMEPETSGLREMDPESNVLWHYPGFIERDFRILDDDKFLIIREDIVFQDRSKGELPLLISPRTEIVDKDGNVLWSWKAEEHLDELMELTGLELNFRMPWFPKDPREEGNPFSKSGRLSVERLKTMDERVRKKNIPALYNIGDWAHSNTCEILKETPVGEKDPRFKKGNILFSFPTIDTIGVIEYPSGKIVWAWGPGELDGQHSPTLLENGNILIFDNGPKRGWSRVIELNPLTEKIVWEYHAQPKESFFSTMLCNAEVLPNGNIFICEGYEARFFQITREGEVVWDYISTLMTSEGGLFIYRAQMYSPEEVAPLLERREKLLNK